MLEDLQETIPPEYTLEEAGKFLARYVHRRTGCRLLWKVEAGIIRYNWIFPPGGSFGARGLYLPWIRRNTRLGKRKIWLLKWGSNNWLYRKWTVRGWRTLYRGLGIAMDKYPDLRYEILGEIELEDFFRVRPY